MTIRSTFRVTCAAALLALLAFAAPPAHALKVATYNLMGYENPGEGPGLPSPYITARQGNFRTVMTALDPDVIMVQEMNSATARDSFLLNVLGVIQPGQWAGSPWFNLSSGEGGAFFWKTSVCTMSNFVSLGTGGPRLVAVGVVKPVGYVKNSAWFRLYSLHLKAGTTAADSTRRGDECTSLRTQINNTVTTVVGPNFVVGGDCNFQGGLERGYQRLTESQANNNGRGLDPLVLPSLWHNGGSVGPYFTQCPCQTCTVTGQSGGGMDDRFDLMLLSSSMTNPNALSLTTYTTFGNDGFHTNTDINGLGFNNAVPMYVADALHDAADHIPVMITLRLPARYSVASQLAFGDEIVGATTTQDFAVSNVAVVPAAPLNYTLAATGAFTAPAGNFSAVAGAGANLHAIGMDASTPGVFTGTLTMASNDNDTTSKVVQLSGRVLAHAVPSLDSATVIAADTLDFGDHEVGSFADGDVRVHDQGWNALQAKLAVTGAVITGDPRFTLVGAFSPATLGGVGQTWTVHFDDTAAPGDSTYEATLAFATSDEALPGATALSPLAVTLRAHVSAGSTGVGSERFALRFLPPSPNPLHGGTQLAYELPSAAHVSLGIYDLGGRRVASLANGFVGEGRHAVRWNTQDDGGRPVAAGLYFVRFETQGLRTTSRLVVLP